MTKNNKQTKKTKTAKPLTASKVAQIAKKAVMKVAETRSPIYSESRNMYAGLVGMRNLNYFISQGDTASTIQGEKVHIKNIRFNLYGEIFNNGDTTNNEVIIRMFFLKSDRQYTNSWTLQTPAAIFRDDGSSSPSDVARTAHIDLHKNKLISKDIRVTLKPSISGQTLVLHKEFDLPINKDCYFRADNSGYFRDGDYYFVIAIQKAGDVGTVVNTALTMQWAVNCKDM